MKKQRDRFLWTVCLSHIELFLWLSDISIPPKIQIILFNLASLNFFAYVRIGLQPPLPRPLLKPLPLVRTYFMDGPYTIKHI